MEQIVSAELTNEELVRMGVNVLDTNTNTNTNTNNIQLQNNTRVQRPVTSNRHFELKRLHVFKKAKQIRLK